MNRRVVLAVWITAFFMVGWWLSIKLQERKLAKEVELYVHSFAE